MRCGSRPESFQRYKGILGALLLITFLSGCKAKEVAPEPGPPEVLVTEVVQRNVPVYSEWVARLNGRNNA
jgi:hypothetical protein